jgi:hypothetical protein
MTQQDAFVQKLSALLDDAPADYSLPEYQALYRQLIFSFGLRILQAFPLQAGRDWHQPSWAAAGQGGGGQAGGRGVSSPPPSTGGGQGTGASPDGGRPGPHPGYVNCFLDFPAFVLGLTP